MNTNDILLVISILSGVLSVGVAVYYFQWVKSQDPGSERAQKVATWIREGAQSYLKKLYGALGMLAVALAIILAVVFGVKEASAGYGLGMAVSFVLGALSSSIAGYMGMGIAVEANVRSATAANKGLESCIQRRLQSRYRHGPGNGWSCTYWYVFSFPHFR